MNFQSTPSHSPYPVTTTTTTSATLITTTTTTAHGALQTLPVLEHRPTGWHASQFKLDWGNPISQQQYLSTTDLPLVHAAVINNDWELASAALRASDIGKSWKASALQRPQQVNDINLAPITWASELPSINPDRQRRAIIDMAIDRVEKTTIEGRGCLYGSNLLTLCLELPARADFIEKLIQLTAEQAPEYLNSPDARGCTPLYIAARRGDTRQAALLLAAGANPQTPCVFQSNDGALSEISAYTQALKSEDSAIVEMFLEKILCSVTWPNGYPVKKDPLQLEKVCQFQNEENIRRLAKKFDAIKIALFNFDDQSGTSLVYRTLKNKQTLDADVIPLYEGDSFKGAIFAAAVSGDVGNFIARMNAVPRGFLSSGIAADSTETSMFRYFLKGYPLDSIPSRLKNLPEIAASLNESDFEDYFVIDELIKIFLTHNSSENITCFLKQCPKAEKNIKEIFAGHFIFNQCDSETFTAIVQAVWPFLDDRDKSTIFHKSSSYSAMHTSFIMDLPGAASLTQISKGSENSFDEYLFLSMLDNASRDRNRVAFELAANTLYKFGSNFMGLKSGKQVFSGYFLNAKMISALKVGSLRWFEEFLRAGMNLQDLLDDHGSEVLPLMADLSPSRLATWLDGLTYTLSEEMIAQTTTAEGAAALSALMKTNLTHQ